MTKLHFDDLTQITCPFGMLDDDTQERLKACDKVQYFATIGWFDQDDRDNRPWNLSYTFRARPQPKRLVTWLRWDETNSPIYFDDLYEADQFLTEVGGYIYRIERDEDGSNPTIELVEVGSKDE